MFSSLLISTCKAHKPRETQGTHCSTLASIYLYKYERSAFFSSILLYVYWSFCLKKKIKTVRHLSFAKSFSLLIFLIIFCVRMGFNGFFSLFCQVLVGFWWVPMMVLTEKNYTYICEENSNRASNKVFFLCKLDCQSFLKNFGLKNRHCCLRKWPWKRKEILRMLLRQIIDIWSNGHSRTRRFHALDNLCYFLLRWQRKN